MFPLVLWGETFFLEEIKQSFIMLAFEKLAAEGILLDNRYRLLNPLSTDGSSATVWLANDCYTADDDNGTSNGMPVIIKIYRQKNILDIEGIEQFREDHRLWHQYPIGAP